mgnify:CR=1 FL=1
MRKNSSSSWRGLRAQYKTASASVAAEKIAGTGVELIVPLASICCVWADMAACIWLFCCVVLCSSCCRSAATAMARQNTSQ